MKMVMHILEGLGRQETKSKHDILYDHPYFGQLFLAGALWIIRYPHLTDIYDGFREILMKSIEVYLFLRLLMGVQFRL
jgi:hypothetical protein